MIELFFVVGRSLVSITRPFSSEANKFNKLHHHEPAVGYCSQFLLFFVIGTEGDRSHPKDKGLAPNNSAAEKDNVGETFALEGIRSDQWNKAASMKI